MTQYRWQQLLNIQLDHVPFQDDLATIARRARLPVGVVEDITGGQYVPDRETLEMLVAALTVETAAKVLIVAEYNNEVDQNRLEEINDPPPASDMLILANAINNLAAAIRELAARP